MLPRRTEDIVEVNIAHLSEKFVPLNHVSALALEADACPAFRVVSRFEELDLDNDIVGLARLDSFFSLDGPNIIRVLSDDNNALRLDAFSLILFNDLDIQLFFKYLSVEGLEALKDDARKDIDVELVLVIESTELQLVNSADHTDVVVTAAIGVLTASIDSGG